MSAEEQRPSSGRHRAAKPARTRKPAAAAQAPPAPEAGDAAVSPPDSSAPTLTKASPVGDAVTEPGELTEPVGPTVRGRPARRGVLLLALLSALTIACAAAALLFYLRAQHIKESRSTTNADPAAVAAAHQAAQDILSYKYLTLDANLAKARSEMTGQLLTEYNSSAAKVLREAPAAKAEIAATIAGQSVVRAQRDRVSMLMYVDLDTVRQLKGSTKPTTSIDASRISVTMTKVNGKWLMSSLDPI